MVKTTKDFVLPDLVESYGDQGITGFLNLVGAVKSGGTSDQIDWWEAGRRHRVYTGAFSNNAAGGAATRPGSVDFTIDTSASGDGVAHVAGLLQANDVVMGADSGIRYIVNEASTATDPVLKLERLDGADTNPSEATTAGVKLVHLGNIYAQGTDQPTHFQDSDVVKRSNPFMIVKDRYRS